MTTETTFTVKDIRTDIEAHRAELPVDTVCCVGCHIAVTNGPELLAEVERLRTLAHVGELAIAYVDTPDGSDETEQAYHELESAVRRIQTADARTANLAREVAHHQRALRDRIRPQVKP